MSERNGDRARFRKLRIRKLRFRTRVREMLQRLAANPGSQPAPAKG